MAFKSTAKQKEALELLKSDARHILLYGGSRSGKTAILVESIIYRALRYPGSRHLIARLRFNHAKTSIWHESLIPTLNNNYKGLWQAHKQDLYVEFVNGSEIWVGGFDDKDRTEKLLGHEFATIYLNEVSQIDYNTVQLAQSRLAQRISGLTNKAYYDCNPPSPLHWAHKLFLEKVEPLGKKKVGRPELYTYLLMNPDDNKENLPEHYIEDMLDTLPERARKRFRLGLWVKSEGVIYDKFDTYMIIKQADLPQIEEYTAGVDFGLHMAGVLIGWAGDNIYVIDDYGAYNTTSSKFNTGIQEVWGEKQYIAYCDPSGGERIQEITAGEKANNSVEPGIDYINAKMEGGQFFVCDNCTGLLSEIWDYRRDEKERIIKENDHYCDAMRYGIFSRVAQGMQVFV